MSFTYTGDLSTALDYARWRLNDTNEALAFMQDETYEALFDIHGEHEGMAMAAAHIATVISQKITSFGETGGIRFSKRNMDYYEELADIIRSEPPYSADAAGVSIKVGRLTKGVEDSYEPYRRVSGYPVPTE